MLAPGGDRVVLVEPHAELDELPEGVDVRVAEQLGRPARVRHAGDDPVVEPLVRLARQLFAELRHPRLADAVARQVGEELRLGVAHQRDDRRVLLAEVLRPLEEPRRRPREDVVGSLLDHRAPDVLVRVADVDVRGAGAVRGPRHRARDVGVLDPRDHLDELAGLDVRADLDDQLRVPVDPRLVQLPHVLAQDRDGRCRPS